MKRAFLILLSACTTVYDKSLGLRYPGREDSTIREGLLSPLLSLFTENKSTLVGGLQTIDILKETKETAMKEKVTVVSRHKVASQELLPNDKGPTTIEETGWDREEKLPIFLGITKNELFRLWGYPDQTDHNSSMERWAYIGKDSIKQVFLKEGRVFAWIVD